MKKSQEIKPFFHVVIVYDSIFGNTQKIAQAMRDGMIEANVTCKIFSVAEVTNGSFETAELIVFGSPTRVFQPTKLMSKLLADKTMNFANRQVAVFDTRAEIKTGSAKFVHTLVEKLGYAAGKMGKQLTARQAILTGDQGAFFVTASEGPLRSGEADRAFLWAKNLIDRLLKAKDGPQPK